MPQMQYVQLPELCGFISGGTPSRTNPEYFRGSIPWITSADLNEDIVTRARDYITQEAIDQSATKIIPKDNILLVTRTGVGKVAITGVDICISQDFTGLLLNKARVDTRYLYYFLFSKQKYFVSFQRGATIQGITREVLEDLQVPLPPLPEQQRIAAILQKADRLRRLRRYARQLSDTYLQSVFLEMFGDLNTNVHGWEIEELGELICGFEAGVNYPPVSDNEPASEWRVLKVSAVTWGEFNPSESKPINPNIQFDEKIIVRQGDLLISRANTTELVGAVSLAENQPPKVLLPDKIWRIQFQNPSRILPQYTLHYLRQKSVRKIIGDLATGSSGSMKNISMDKATTLPIMIPPIFLQKDFALKAKQFSSFFKKHIESERQAEHLFQSLLQRAFQGKL